MALKNKLKTYIRRFRVLKNIETIARKQSQFSVNVGCEDIYTLCLLTELDKRALLAMPKYADPKRLDAHGYKVYSQNDEDGIIAEIFRRIGTTNRYFVEFGVQDGLECNSHYLLFQGWEGTFIEGSAEFCDKIRKNFAPVLENGRLTLLNSFIDAQNINTLIGSTKAGKLRDIDLLSIDIDGNDYHVWQSIDVIAPRVVVIEMNAKFPPPCEYVMPYNAQHIWDGTDTHGASLQSLANLGAKKGYKLVGTNISGVNAFFVRADLCEDKFADDDSAANLYNPWRLYRYLTGHESKYFLENAANLG